MLLTVVVIATGASTYFGSLFAIVSFESYSDYTCVLLYEDAWPGEPLTRTRGPNRTYSDPGYTCRYLVEGEWVTLRKDLTEARGMALAVAALATVAVGAWISIYWFATPKSHTSR